MKKVKQKYVRKALFLCKLALTVLLLFMMARMFVILGGSNVVFTPSAVSAAEDSDEATETGPSQNIQNYTAIISHSIFGISDDAASPTNSRFHETSGPLDEQLGIALVGTIAGSRAVSRAIIKDLKTGSVGLYQIGDTVATATIENIEKECVVLSSRGSIRTLCLGTEDKSTGSRAVRSLPKLQTNQDIAESPPAYAASPSAASQSSGSDIESALSAVVIEPHRTNDNVDGLKISGLDDAPLAKALGLQDGDVIQVVNGQSVKSKQQAFQILKKAQAQDSISVKLMRNDKVETLFFPLMDRR